MQFLQAPGAFSAFPATRLSSAPKPAPDAFFGADVGQAGCAGKRRRLWVLSDLHLGAGRSAFELARVPSADVAVVGGDVCEGLVRAVTWVARSILPHMPVIMVAGNHEYYRTVLPDELARGQEAAAKLGVNLLENRTVEVAGLRFSGCSLFTNYELYGSNRRSVAMEAARRGMTDHHSILARSGMRQTPELFMPEHALGRHLESIRFLRAALLCGDAEPRRTVVVTHHAPSRRSIHHSYAGDPLNPAFASDLDYLIQAARPMLWVHGHVHSSFDYQISATRVLCNPKGYGPENLAFDPTLVLNVGHG